MAFEPYGKRAKVRFRTEKGHWVLKPCDLIPPYYVFFNEADMNRAAMRSLILTTVCMVSVFVIYAMEHSGLDDIVEALPWGLYSVIFVFLAYVPLMFLIMPKRVIYRKKIHGALIPEQKPE